MPPRSPDKSRPDRVRPGLDTYASPQSAADPAKRADAARYMSQMLAELVAMARAHRFGLLAYLLDMARLEARTHARPSKPRT
jgi:hypothetical protein